MGRCKRASNALSRGALRAARSTPKTLGDLKTIVIVILVVGMAVLAISHRVLLCMHYACYSNKKQQRQGAEQRREGDRPDRPKRTKEETPKPERKAEGVGCESGT